MSEPTEFPELFPTTTYLREVALEGQELFMELRYAGFTETQATNFVAQMVSDTLNSSNEATYSIEYTAYEEDDDADEDEPYDDGVSGQ